MKLSDTQVTIIRQTLEATPEKVRSIWQEQLLSVVREVESQRSTVRAHRDVVAALRALLARAGVELPSWT